MIIRHILPNGNYVKLDKSVLSHKDLTDGAKVLFAYLCCLRNGRNLTDTYLMKVLRLSQSALTRRKRELKDAGLILIDQVRPKLYVVYIGHTKLPATAVKVQWDKDEAYEEA